MHEETQPERTEFLTFDEVMEYLRVSRPTLYKMLANEQVPGAFRIGKLWRVSKRVFLEKMGEEDQ